MTKKILIYDNNEDVRKNWTDKLEKLELGQLDYKPYILEDAEFNEIVTELLHRQTELRDGNPITFGHRIDETVIFIIDYDLFNPKDPLVATGDEMAYLVRCFSLCGLIIGVNKFTNQFDTNYFDLTLKGDLDSFCDLTIGEDHLDVQGLWRETFEGFRPWSWPILPNYYESFKEKIEEILKNPDELICNTLQINEKIQYFPNSIKEYIGNEPEKTSFTDFVFKSRNGLRGRFKELDAKLLARIAAARISKWFEFKVLTGQNILVDAPHLASRFPSLFSGERERSESWNELTSFDYDKLPLDKEKLDKYRFVNTHWLSRPCWFWEDLSNNTEISEVTNPWDREENLYYFCEDSSEFNKKEECVEFNIDTESPYKRRYVIQKPFEYINYQPAVRLLKK